MRWFECGKYRYYKCAKVEAESFTFSLFSSVCVSLSLWFPMLPTATLTLQCPFFCMRYSLRLAQSHALINECVRALLHTLVLFLYASKRFFASFVVYYHDCRYFSVSALAKYIINTFMIHIKYCTSWTTFNTLLCCFLPPLPLLMSLYAIHLLFCIGLYPVRMSGAFHHGSIFLALPFSLLRLAKNFDHFSTEFNLYLARHTQWNNATFFRTRKVRLAESVKLYQKLSILY